MEQKFEEIQRPVVPELDEVLGKPFYVLNDGFVRVVDYMGSDDSIVQAARVSYGKGTKKKHQDRGLIRYLMRHDHTTPFEMCEIKMHVRVPMDAWRQWIRHRTANINEYSTRYSVAIDATQITEPNEWRLQAESNRQGSEGTLEVAKGKELTQKETDLHNMSRQLYEERLELGIAREQARKDLPLCTYTEAYWKIDLHNLLRFLRLRMDTHAQYEIRMFAQTIGREIVSRWVPLAWEAFRDYKISSQFFSQAEKEIVRAIMSDDGKDAIKLAEKHGLIKYKDGKITGNLERMELEQKLNELNVTPPWK